MTRLLALTLALLAAPALAEPALQLAPALGRPEAVRVMGRVLRDAPSQGSSTLSRNVRRLLAAPQPGARVQVQLGDTRATVVTGAGGRFEVVLRPAQPLRPGHYWATARTPGGGLARAPVQVVDTRAPFLVVSDLDDTLAVSEVRRPTRLVSNALLRDADTQAAVEGMADFYRCLGDEAPARPGFALVSGTPQQFAPRVARFLALNRFPAFGLYLRALSPATLSGYKPPRLRTLLADFPGRVVLVGDSGEHDPEIYAALAREFPGRVAAIYIRDAGRAEDPARFDGMVLFRHPREAARHAARAGLASDACVARAFPAPGLVTAQP